MDILRNYTVGDEIQTTLLMKAATIRQTKNGKDYLQATMADSKVDIDTKMWDWNGPAPGTNVVYNVTGTIGEFNGNKQLILKSLLRAAAQDISVFMPSVDEPIPELETRLWTAVSTIEQPKLHFIVDSLFQEHMDAFVRSTAAKRMHHVGVGGLAKHTLEVFNTAVLIAKAYPKYDLNLDLIRAGALLHDIGKIASYQHTLPTFDTTLNGALLDHIPIGSSMLEAFMLTADYRDTVGDISNHIKLLQHIILSHHGKYEYGSPITPMFMEAYIVHWADNISSTIDMLAAANEQLKADEIFTPKIYPLNNRQHISQKGMQTML